MRPAVAYLVVDPSDCAWGLVCDSVQTCRWVRKWHSLAERRRRHFVELYRSERWKRYYTEEEFRAHMREVDANVEIVGAGAASTPRARTGPDWRAGIDQAQ